MHSTIDTIRAVYSYTIALVIVVGGGAILFMTYADERSANLHLILAGFIGAAVSWVFGAETQARTARQTASAHTTGAIAHANGLAGQAPPPASGA